MESTPEQKELARAYVLEQSGQLDAALEIYRGLAGDTGDDPAAAKPWLHASDVQLRLGDTVAAVASLERAIELYRSAGLVNNAIALCHRVLRTDPQHSGACLTLARLAIEKGYLSAARDAYLAHAEAAEQAGDGDGVLLALREAGAHFPHDEGIRSRLAARGEDVDMMVLLDPPVAEVAAEHTPAPEGVVERLEGFEAGDEIGLLPVEPLSAGEPAAAETVAEPVAPLAGLETTHFFDPPAEEVENDAAPAEDEPLPLLGTEPVVDDAGLDGPPAPGTTPEYVDLGALVLGDEPEEESARFLAAAKPPSGDEDHDLTEVLNTFREKVSEKLDRNDAASHYDLGLAFKDMGLLDDAIGQLQTALRGGADLLSTLEVLGECYLEKGEHELASRVLRRATQLADSTDVDLVGVHYWLARSADTLGDVATATGYYQRVVAVDRGFRDAADRLRALADTF